MAYEYSDLISDIEKWTQQSINQGWLNKQLASSLLGQKTDSANELFEVDNARPLVVAFMGGTGVGKSSLLNKLAGQSIARTGVERPTSREVTLFHHQSVSMRQLEEKFPLQQIQISQHTEVANEKIIWIDMPDFDSIEEQNKNIVMQWLPYVDVLIYVVSPERYRDNKAWQLLQSNSANHAWLFVMNQWDRGEASQFDDFKKQLAKAGFDNPLIYKTICVEQAEDELPQLQAAIESIATDKTVAHLQKRGLLQRKKGLKQKLLRCSNALGSGQMINELLDYQQDSWQQTEKILDQGFDWPIKQASIAFSKTKIGGQREKVKLWDEWSQSRFDDYLNNLILAADQKGLPSIPLRQALLEIRAEAEGIVHTQAELGCRKSLINPGNVIQRVFLKVIRICELFLPLIAMGVVGFQVFYGYYDSSITDEAFLGVDFAVHSLLLILLSWLVPYFIRKKMQPSLEKAALKGFYNGLEIAKVTIDMGVKRAMQSFHITHQEIINELKMFIAACDEEDNSLLSGPKSEQLTRMLVDK